jgi:hypothetical protein
VRDERGICCCLNSERAKIVRGIRVGSGIGIATHRPSLRTALAAALCGLPHEPVLRTSKDRTEKAKDRLVAGLRLLQVRRVSR